MHQREQAESNSPDTVHIHRLGASTPPQGNELFQTTGVIINPHIPVRTTRSVSLPDVARVVCVRRAAPRSMITPSYYLDATAFCAPRRTQQRRHRFPADLYYGRHCAVLPRTPRPQKDDGRKLLEDRHFRSAAAASARFVPVIIPRIGSWKEHRRRAPLHNGG